MSIVLTVEERLTALEKEVLELKLAQKSPKHIWLDRISGAFKDDPGFGEILRLGRQISKSENIEQSAKDA